MPNVKLTEAIVAKISSPSETIFWDTELTGLGLRVWSSGKKVYIVQHRNKQTQKLHKVTLGASSTVELKHARELASKHIYECNAELLVNGVKTITLKDMAQLYLKERYGKKKSLDQDEYKIKKYIIPVLGSRLVKSITSQDVIDIQSKIFSYMVTANRVLDTLSSLFKFALDMNFAKENPVTKVKKYPEYKKEAYLSLEEINRLWYELSVYETHYPRSLYVINAIRLLMLTGARLREILKLTWNEVNLDSKLIVLNDRKTTKKYIYLSNECIQVLQNIPRKNNYVIPGRIGGNQYIYRVWFAIRDKCEFTKKITLHTLRHSYASVAISHGVPLSVVGELLGHSSLRSTERYAHLYTSTIQEASQKVGGIFHANIRGK